MQSFKVFVIGLIAAWVCMGDIRGIVTLADTSGTVPIDSALVVLMQSGLQAVTDTSGKFSIPITTIGYRNKISRTIPAPIAAIIQSNSLHLKLPLAQSLEIIGCDLHGKLFMHLNETRNSGTFSYALPRKGDGIYLYKINVSGKAIILKCSVFGGVWRAMSGAADIPFGSTKTSPVAIAQRDTTSDTLMITKNGYVPIKIKVTYADTNWIAIKLSAVIDPMVDGDGNVYKAVRIGHHVWITENLRTTKYADGTSIIFDTSSTSWANSKASIFCYYGNTTNADSIKKNGALYNWYVIDTAHTKNIAPKGWHVPSQTEWENLRDNTSSNGKSLAAQSGWSSSNVYSAIGYDMKNNNSTGFTAFAGGFRNNFGDFSGKGTYGMWWSAIPSMTAEGMNSYLYYDDGGMFVMSNSKCCGFSVRLVRD